MIYPVSFTILAPVLVSRWHPGSLGDCWLTTKDCPGLAMCKHVQTMLDPHVHNKEIFKRESFELPDSLLRKANPKHKNTTIRLSDTACHLHPVSWAVEQILSSQASQWSGQRTRMSLVEIGINSNPRKPCHQPLEPWLIDVESKYIYIYKLYIHMWNLMGYHFMMDTIDYNRSS